MITYFKDEYRWLSNFVDADVIYEGVKYPSVENAYQAAKFSDPKDRVKFETCKAFEAKRLGKGKQPSDWHTRSISIMKDLVRQKFLNNDNYRTLLANTNDELIVEGNTWGDTFWGQCPLGNGENHLGKILMEIRYELRQH